jgi:hypothetical protein
MDKETSSNLNWYKNNTNEVDRIQILLGLCTESQFDITPVSDDNNIYMDKSLKKEHDIRFNARSKKVWLSVNGNQVSSEKSLVFDKKSPDQLLSLKFGNLRIYFTDGIVGI